MANDYLAKIKLQLEGKDQVVSGLQQTQSAAQKLSETQVAFPWAQQRTAQAMQPLAAGIKGVGEETKKSFNQMNDFEKALRRALIVAPVWMAARAAIQFFVEGFKSGVDMLIKFDEQMLLVEQTLRALGENPNIEKLRDSFDRLSISTGRALSSIVSDYQILLKATGDAKSAQEGLTSTTQLQEVAQLKSADTVKAVALAYKLQGDSIDKASTPTQKFNVIVSSFNEMAAKNMVTVEELAKEYNTFVPTAKAMNLTFEQTLGLLATLNSQGVQNVQGLRTALLRLFTEQQKIAPTLGIAVTPDVKPYQLFIAVLEKINALTTENKPIPPAVKELFGIGAGRGGAQTVLALGDALKVLKDNVNAAFPDTAIKNFNKNLDETNKSLSHNIEIAKNLNTHIFAAFVEGLKGTEFEKNLQHMNDLSKKYGESISKALGSSLNMTENRGGALFGGLGSSFTFAVNLIKNIQKQRQEVDEESRKATEDSIAATLSENKNLENQKAVEAEIVAHEKTLAATRATEATETDNLLDKAKQRLVKADEQIKVEALAAEGLSKTQISYVEIIDLVKKLGDEHDKMTDPITKKLIPALDRQHLLNAIISGDYNTMISMLKGTLDIESRLPDIEKARNDLIKSRIHDLEQEKETITSLVLQYEKANGADRSKIRRQIELQAMPAEDVVARFQQSSYDRRLITESISSFSKEIQTAIASRVAFEHNLGPARTLLGSPYTAPNTIPSQAITQQANFGNVNINIAPEDLEKFSMKAAAQLQKALEQDSNLQKFLAKVVRPNV
jgi:TP901 family phage tail tape measure protein